MITPENSPHIWVPSRRLITPKGDPIMATPTVRFGGRFQIHAVGLDGSRRLLADWWDNLILDNGKDLLGSSGSWLTYCSVGTGTTAPANGQTALVTGIATTNTLNGAITGANSGSAPYYGTNQRTYRFGIGAAAGNLSEVGVGATNGYTNLFTRSRILDGSGVPTTITVLGTEALDVSYQLRLYCPPSDVTGTITINAVSYSYVLRAMNATSTIWNPGFNAGSGTGGTIAGAYAGSPNGFCYNGALGAITGAPGGTAAVTATNASNAAYTNGTYNRDMTFSWGLATGNVAGGASCISGGMGSFNDFGAFQCSFSPSLPKDATKIMTLVFRLAWDRF